MHHNTVAGIQLVLLVLVPVRSHGDREIQNSTALLELYRVYLTSERDRRLIPGIESSRFDSSQYVLISVKPGGTFLSWLVVLPYPPTRWNIDSSSLLLLLLPPVYRRLFGWFIVSAQTQPLVQAFVPFIHDKMITSCTKTCQRAGRRHQNGLIFYCCCSHTTSTTAGTGYFFHTGPYFSRTRPISALRWSERWECDRFLSELRPTHLISVWSERSYAPATSLIKLSIAVYGYPVFHWQTQHDLSDGKNQRKSITFFGHHPKKDFYSNITHFFIILRSGRTQWFLHHSLHIN